MLHANGGGLPEAGRPVDLSGAERHIVGLRSLTRVDAGGCATAQVFQMHERPAVRVLREQLGRVLSGVRDPKNIHLEADELRFRFRHQQIEVRPLAALCERTEFITMRMIAKRDAGSLEPPRPLVEVRRRAANVRLGEVSLVGIHAHIANFASNACARRTAAPMSFFSSHNQTRRLQLQAAFVQQGIELLDAEPVVAAAFDFGEPSSFTLSSVAGTFVLNDSRKV